MGEIDGSRSRYGENPPDKPANGLLVELAQEKRKSAEYWDLASALKELEKTARFFT